MIQSIISIQDSEIPIPSLPQISAAEETRYLRDSLIRYSYWNLALDISTKCMLDTHSVWVSWGLSCLKDGHYDAAREKLKHCLQPIGSTPQQQGRVIGMYSQISRNCVFLETCHISLRCNLNYEIYTLLLFTNDLCIPLVPSQQHQSLVSQIVEQIEGSFLFFWSSDEILQSIRKDNTQSLNTILDESKTAGNTPMNHLQFEEVQYYLKSYGTHRQMLEFLVKYKMVKRACLYVQSQVSIILRTFC